MHCPLVTMVGYPLGAALYTIDNFENIQPVFAKQGASLSPSCALLEPGSGGSSFGRRRAQSAEFQSPEFPGPRVVWLSKAAQRAQTPGGRFGAPFSSRGGLTP